MAVADEAARTIETEVLHGADRTNVIASFVVALREAVGGPDRSANGSSG